MLPRHCPLITTMPTSASSASAARSTATVMAVCSSCGELTAPKYSVSWWVDQWKSMPRGLGDGQRDEGQVVHATGTLGTGHLAIGVEATEGSLAQHLADGGRLEFGAG